MTEEQRDQWDRVNLSFGGLMAANDILKFFEDSLGELHSSTVALRIYIKKYETQLCEEQDIFEKIGGVGALFDEFEKNLK